jgi:hypothetical protein
MHLIRHLCHIFSEMVESERHAYLIVILQQQENEVGFSAEGGNCSGRPENDNRRLQSYRYTIHTFSLISSRT